MLHTLMVITLTNLPKAALVVSGRPRLRHCGLGLATSQGIFGELGPWKSLNRIQNAPLLAEAHQSINPTPARHTYLHYMLQPMMASTRLASLCPRVNRAAAFARQSIPVRGRLQPKPTSVTSPLRIGQTSLMTTSSANRPQLCVSEGEDAEMLERETGDLTSLGWKVDDRRMGLEASFNFPNFTKAAVS